MVQSKMYHILTNIITYVCIKWLSKFSVVASTLEEKEIDNIPYHLSPAYSTSYSDAFPKEPVTP